MSVPTIRCVVFDIDDTLYLERDYVRSGFRAAGVWARERFGFDEFEDQAWSAFLAGRRGMIFNEVLDASGLAYDTQDVRRLIEVYRGHVPAISLLPDARTCLDRLVRRVAVAALTDGPLTSQRAKADALELSRWASPIVFTAELGEGFSKPSPDAFRFIEARTGCGAGACAYVADNPAKDFTAPRELGWRTIRVRRSGGLHQDVESGGNVDLELPDLDGLFGALALSPADVTGAERAR